MFREILSVLDPFRTLHWALSGHKLVVNNILHFYSYIRYRLLAEELKVLYILLLLWLHAPSVQPL